MNIRKILLFFISLLPISSISFAKAYDDALGDRHSEKHFNLEDEMVRRLNSGDIPDKYYSFLDKYEIKDTRELLSSKRNRHRKLLLKKFTDEFKGIEVTASAVSEIIED